MCTHISLLVPHLGGKAYPLRSAIVTAVGHILVKGLEDAADGADAQGTASSAEVCFVLSQDLKGPDSGLP